MNDDITWRVQRMEQELPTLPEHLSSPAVFSGIRVARTFVFCAMFCRSLFLLFLLVIASSALQFTVSAYPFDIFKLFSLTLFPPMIIPLYSIQLYVITFVSIAFSSTNNTHW